MGFPVCEHSLHIACQSATDIYKHSSYSPDAALIKNTTFLYLRCGGSVSAGAFSTVISLRVREKNSQFRRVLLLGLVF